MLQTKTGVLSLTSLVYKVIPSILYDKKFVKSEDAHVYLNTIDVSWALIT